MRPVFSRPLLSLSALALLVSACDSPSSGPSAYEAWADKVATIPLSPAEDSAARHAEPVRLPLDTEPREPKTTGTPASMKVELVSPHQLWDLRDGPIKLPSIEVSEANLPLTPARSTPAAAPAQASGMPAPDLSPASDTTRTIQLGAYSSRASAEQAWTRLSSGAQGAALRGLSPQYDPVQRADRTLIRLRVAANADQAHRLCQTLAANDPWCQRASS